MMIKILDYLFLIKSLSSTQQKMYKDILKYLYQLIPFTADLSKTVRSNIESNVFKIELESKNICKIYAPLELYII